MAKTTSSPKRRASAKRREPARAGRKASPPSDAPARRPPPRFAAEQFNRIVSRILEQQNFETIEEANEFLEKNVNSRTVDELMAGYEPEPEEVAQDLVYEAMGAEDLEETLDLLGRALKLDPDNIDALSMLAGFAAENEEDLVKSYASIVERAAGRLGAAFIRENKGHFWGIPETRPYMRARASLVSALRKAGRLDEAIGHCEAMLELNPNDNQGMRDILLGLYLQTDRLEGARRLFKKYRESFFAIFNWAKVLERYLSGDLEGAKAAYVHADAENRYVRDYLTGKKAPPKSPPDYYSPGDRNEACVCMAEIGHAWRSHPEALEWLRGLQPAGKQ